MTQVRKQKKAPTGSKAAPKSKVNTKTKTSEKPKLKSNEAKPALANTNSGGKPERVSFQIVLTLTSTKPRIDQVLLEALRTQTDNHFLRNISRSVYKELFNKKRIRIKGQPARPSSSLAAGSTTVDILGYAQKDPA